MTPQATYARLPSGDWGVRIPLGSSRPKPGDIVTATTRRGRTSNHVVTMIFSESETYTLATISKQIKDTDTMPRNPSLSREDALAQCVASCGPRGDADINSENRTFVRRWLVAEGVPSAYVHALSLTSLQGAYNDHTNTTLAAIRTMASKRASSYEPTDAPDTSDSVTDSAQLCPHCGVQHHGHDTCAMHPRYHPKDDKASAARAPDVQPGNATGQDFAARKLAEALSAFAALNNKPNTLDEGRVIELVREHAPKSEPLTYKVEIKLPDRPVFTTDNKPRHEVFPEALAAMGAGLNVLFVGPAGCGKTHLGEQLAEALSSEFRFSGAVASEYKLLGFIDAQGRLIETEYRKSYEHGSVFLWDEMDASAPGALLAFNAGLANGHQDFPDKVVKRHERFRALASCNTYGHGADRMYVGRNQLDAASLDRFYVIPMDYDQKLERALYGDDEWTGYVHRVRQAVRTLSIRHVVSMRAIDHGQKMLRCGVARDKIERAVIWKHLSAPDINKIKASM